LSQPFFRPARQTLVVIGNPEHPRFGFLVAHLFSQNPRFLSALSPAIRVIDEILRASQPSGSTQAGKIRRDLT